MSVFDTTALNTLYQLLSSPCGMAVAEFQRELSRLFALPRTSDDLTAYRLSRSAWKKLADEVSPVSRFLRWQVIQEGRVRFPLDNHSPDCWLLSDDNAIPQGIEVTIAQARERYHLAREMIEAGWGRGFIGVSDDAPQSEFDRTMSRQRVTYTTDQALLAVDRGIRRCLARKNRPAFAGFILVVQAPLSALPNERWRALVGGLRAAAASLPFRSVYVIGNPDESPRGFRLK